MPIAFAALTLAGIMLYSGLKGLSIMEVLAGEKGTPLDPRGGQNVVAKNQTVEQTQRSTLAAGGTWGGSKAPADALRDIAREASGGSVKVISSKRATKGTASGGVSDHWVGKTDAYAYDLSDDDEPSPGMDKAAVAIMAALGASYDGKSELVFNTTTAVPGYRIQVLYRTQVGGNHNNHIHVGVDKL